MSAWPTVAHHVNRLRRLQAADGSALPSAALTHHTAEIGAALGALGDELPEQRAFLETVHAELEAWAALPQSPPVFAHALAAFAPVRRDGARWIALFPMVLPNASSARLFDAALFETWYPVWLAAEAVALGQRRFLPARILGGTEGYDNDGCAVLFAESVDPEAPPPDFAIFFVEREALRFHAFMRELGAPWPPHFDGADDSAEVARAVDAFALWDLYHEAAHHVGPLPLYSYLYGRNAPFWLGAVEELRVDLHALLWATARGDALGGDAGTVIVLDRALRFSVSGPAERNTDALAGLALFGALERHGALCVREGILQVEWHLVRGAVARVLEEIDAIYRRFDPARESDHWAATEAFVRGYAPFRGETHHLPPFLSALRDRIA
jgi:hypothetical protein